MACVYKHTNKINGKVYIGYTNQIPEHRWRPDGSGYINRGQTYFCNAINKYGWDNFEHEILFAGLTTEEAQQKEIEMINKYKSYDPAYGYNSTFGGEGCTPTDTARKHLSDAHKGLSYPNRKSSSPSNETRKKLSDANKGKKPWNYGIKTGPLSDTTKQKIGDANRGINNGMYGKTPYNKGKPLSAETKKKLSEANKGRSCYWKGKKRPPISEETRQKYRDMRKGRQLCDAAYARSKEVCSVPVVCVETGIVYASIHDAGIAVGLKNPANICACCKGTRNIAGGYHWKYYNKEVK